MGTPKVDDTKGIITDENDNVNDGDSAVGGRVGHDDDNNNVTDRSVHHSEGSDNNETDFDDDVICVGQYPSSHVLKESVKLEAIASDDSKGRQYIDDMSIPWIVTEKSQSVAVLTTTAAYSMVTDSTAIMKRTVFANTTSTSTTAVEPLSPKKSSKSSRRIAASPVRVSTSSSSSSLVRSRKDRYALALTGNNSRCKSVPSSKRFKSSSGKHRQSSSSRRTQRITERSRSSEEETVNDNVHISRNSRSKFYHLTKRHSAVVAVDKEVHPDVRNERVTNLHCIYKNLPVSPHDDYWSVDAINPEMSSVVKNLYSRIASGQMPEVYRARRKKPVSFTEEDDIALLKIAFNCPADAPITTSKFWRQYLPAFNNTTQDPMQLLRRIRTLSRPRAEDELFQLLFGYSRVYAEHIISTLGYGSLTGSAVHHKTNLDMIAVVIRYLDNRFGELKDKFHFHSLYPQIDKRRDGHDDDSDCGGGGGGGGGSVSYDMEKSGHDSVPLRFLSGIPSCNYSRYRSLLRATKEKTSSSSSSSSSPLCFWFAIYFIAFIIFVTNTRHKRQVFIILDIPSNHDNFDLS